MPSFDEPIRLTVREQLAKPHRLVAESVKKCTVRVAGKDTYMTLQNCVLYAWLHGLMKPDQDMAGFAS
jgi:hypothetical protein